MNRSFACLVLTGLALVAGGAAVMSASEPPLTTDVDVLVNGTPQTRFAHGGRWYVEALKGREYAIRLRNPYGVRVAVALSVDGLNTIDARHTNAADARKWIIEPYQTITISGWQTSRTAARRFEFTTEENSYGQALGKTANLGVISAVFFKERVRTRTSEPSKDQRRREPAAPSESAKQEPAAARDESRAYEEYAATGMGRRTGHAVEQVWLDLEDAPAQSVNIRYEFRPQLVRLGVLTPPVPADRLQQRERTRGFEPGYCPEPPRRR